LAKYFGEIDFNLAIIFSSTKPLQKSWLVYFEHYPSVQMGFYDMQLVEKDDLPFDNKVLWQAMCTDFTIILKTFIKVYCIRKGKNGTVLYQSKISCRCQKFVFV